MRKEGRAIHPFDEIEIGNRSERLSMILRDRKTGKRTQVLRDAAALADSEEPDVIEVLTDDQQRRRDEANAILLKPQPPSNGSVDGIEI